MTAYRQVASATDVAPGTRSVFDIADHEILLTNVEGTVFATDNICTCIAVVVGHKLERDETDPHTHGGRLSRLQDAALDGTRITCPDHGSTYELSTGKVVSGCAEIPLNTYEVRLQGDALEVAEMADCDRHFWNDDGATLRP